MTQTQKVKQSMCAVGVLTDWACCLGVWPKSKTTDRDWKKRTATSPETSERMFSKTNKNVQDVCLDSEHTTLGLLTKSMVTASTWRRQCRLGCNFKVYHGTVNTQVQCSTVYCTVAWLSTPPRCKRSDTSSWCVSDWPSLLPCVWLRAQLLLDLWCLTSFQFENLAP